MSRSTSNKRVSSVAASPFSDALRDCMSRDLQLQGLADRTHDGYLREVKNYPATTTHRPISCPSNKSESTYCI